MKLLTRREVIQTFNQVFPNSSVSTEDSHYAIPTRKWLEDEFGPYFYKLKQSRNITYSPQTFDCEDFAQLYKTEAKLAHNRTSPNSNASLAVGSFNYTKQNGEPHAADIALVWENDQVTILCTEPQNEAVFKPTPDEIRSTTAIDF